MDADGCTGRVRRVDTMTMLGVFKQTNSVMVLGASAVSVVVKCITGPGFMKSSVLTSRRLHPPQSMWLVVVAVVVYTVLVCSPKAIYEACTSLVCVHGAVGLGGRTSDDELASACRSSFFAWPFWGMCRSGGALGEHTVNVVRNGSSAVTVPVTTSIGPMPPMGAGYSVVMDSAHPSHGTRSYTVSVAVYTVCAMAGVHSPRNPDLVCVITVVQSDGDSSPMAEVPPYGGGVGSGAGTGLAPALSANAKRQSGRKAVIWARLCTGEGRYVG